MAASSRQNRGERFRKFFRGEFSEAFPSELYQLLALRKRRAFAEFARLTAPTQSKAGFFSPNSRDFGGVEPPKSLGENSCFPLKPFSAFLRVFVASLQSRAPRGVARLRRESSRSALQSLPRGSDPFSEEKGSETPKKTLSASRFTTKAWR